MQREQLEQIVKSLDTGTLIDMLRVAGINFGPQQQADLEDQGGDKIEPWNEMKISIPRTSRPQINDPQTYLRDEAQASGTMPRYLQESPNMEDWAADSGDQG